MKEPRLDRASSGGLEFEYEIPGSGEPVVFIHPGHFASWFKPLENQAALASRYRLLRYHRAGCAGISRTGVLGHPQLED
jgi:pimeloyl-ACP methyl ester carboxylesterase